MLFCEELDMARAISTDPLMSFRFHAQWGDALTDLPLSKASFRSHGTGGMEGNGSITLKRALYGGSDDAMLNFLSVNKETRLLLHIYHITSGFDEKTRCWTDPALTVEFNGIIPSAARFQKWVELDAKCSDVLEIEVNLNFSSMRFLRGDPKGNAQADPNIEADWMI